MYKFMNLIILLPLISLFVAQVIKFFIKSNKRNFNLKNLFSYSGMPSGHSAMVISLTSIIGLTTGWESPMFGLSLVFAIIVIRDAFGIRKYLGQHGNILNILVKDLDDDKMLDKKYPQLLEKIGHTPMQIIAGSLIGLTISLIGYYIF